MGQAWCKEKTTKAQDSKSPLDRVFVRCAHQIYPTLKQDGSVLGGATQRVTSSEIGYAGSPPREALTRGESVDSIDRPFHPSEWVDVNLEVPSTPSSVITNLTAKTSLCRTTTPSSTGSNAKKNITPIPPPRRRRKNRGRPLPPKPDEVVKTHGNGKKVEPLYSSVKSKLKNPELKAAGDNPKSNNERNEKKEEIQKISRKEIPEIKVNGAQRIQAITEATEADRWTARDPGEPSGEEDAHHEKNGMYPSHKNPNKNKNNNNNEDADAAGEDNKRNNQDLEYEKFSKSHELRSSSTPNGPAKNPEWKSSPGKDLREFLTRTIMDDDDILDTAHYRPKNYSTVSLPNYDELEVVKKEVDREQEDQQSELTVPKKPGRVRNISTISLPMTEMVKSLPQGSTDRLEKYMTRCRSFGSLQPHEILDKLTAHGEEIDSSDEDEWGGLDDWDLGVIEDPEPSDGRSPLEPSSRLRERKGTAAPPPTFVIGEGDDLPIEKKAESKTVDIPKDLNSSDEDKASNRQNLTLQIDTKTLSLPRNASFEMPKSPNSILKSALKAEVNRKISMPARFGSDKPGSPLEDWFSAQERSVRFFEAPKLEEEYANTPGHMPAKPSEVRKLDIEYDERSYPFNGGPTGPLDIDTFFGEDQDFCKTKNSSDLPGRQERAKNLTRSLSNESEPFEGYEEKELTLDIRSQPSSIGKLSRTISDESIPAEMAADGDDSLSEKETADRGNGHTAGSQDSKTPPPSPEPKIHAEILKVENFPGARSTSLKIPGDDEAGSNLSSMTPSLTELEAALSDMLEKEDHDEPRPGQDHVEDSEGSNLRHSEALHSLDKPIEPKILPKPSEREIGKGLNPEEAASTDGNLFVRRRKENVAISLGQILNDVGKLSGIEEPDSVSGKLSLEKKLGTATTPESHFEGKTKKKGEGEKAQGKNPFEDTDDEQENEGGDPDDEFRTGSNAPRTTNAGSTSLNPFDGEPPEKPSRLQKVPLDQSGSERPEVPTPPQRKNKHGLATSPTTKSPTSHIESEFPIRDSSPHPNDRLI